MSAIKSGDLVLITCNKTNEEVYKGYILGMNAHVVITSKPDEIEAKDIKANFSEDLIKHPHFKEILLDKKIGGLFSLNRTIKYTEYSLKNYTVKTISENKSNFKAEVCNSVYDFRANEWVSWNKDKHSNFFTFATNENIKPVNHVEIIGMENDCLYMIVCGVKSILRYPNINQWEQLQTGIYDLIQDPYNSEMLMACLIESHETEARNKYIKLHEKGLKKG